MSYAQFDVSFCCTGTINVGSSESQHLVCTNMAKYFAKQINFQEVAFRTNIMDLKASTGKQSQLWGRKMGEEAENHETWKYKELKCTLPL